MKADASKHLKYKINLNWSFSQATKAWLAKVFPLFQMVYKALPMPTQSNLNHNHPIDEIVQKDFKRFIKDKGE